MKNRLTPVLPLLLIIGLCVYSTYAQTSSSNLKKKIAASKVLWQKLKKQWGNSYTYVTEFSSSEGAFTIRKYITVKNGQVVQATETFTRFEKNAKTKRQKLTGKALAKLGTMDDVYKFAEEELIKKSPKKNYITFTTFKNGLISAAGYFPKMCADDCYKGYTLDSIAPTN